MISLFRFTQQQTLREVQIVIWEVKEALVQEHYQKGVDTATLYNKVYNYAVHQYFRESQNQHSSKALELSRWSIHTAIQQFVVETSP